jgi:deazaflavin-dependent oxidoreductase (nitroreductase family)
MPTDRQLHAMNRVHHGLLKVSGGRLGWRIKGMPMLELTTIGRKSGLPRTVMLASPLQEGKAIVIVASRGGDDQHPNWFINLREHPEVRVSFAGEPKRSMRARVAGPEERAVLWPRVTEANPGYASYQKKTDREIPLVLLGPVESGQ